MTQYTLKRSRRRTICLRVEQDGSVCVTAPYGAPEEQIDAFVEKSRGFIQRQRQIISQRLEKYPPLDERAKAELRRRAESYLPQRTEYYAGIMGLEPSYVKITGAERRFGSCNGKNGICYSYRLMRYPDEAIDYVIVHELAHIVHKNHGRDFYRLIEKYLPDHREREKLLR